MIHTCSSNKCFCVFYTGEYICKLTLDIFEYESRKKINVTPIQIFSSEDVKVTCDNNPVSLNCCSEINVNWSRVEWKQEGEISIPGKNVRWQTGFTNWFLSPGYVKMGDAVGGRQCQMAVFFP